MNITKIALASALVAIASQAGAATIYLSGASATSINYVKGLKSLCAGTYTVFKSNTTADALGNDFTAKCSANFAGLSYDTVAFDVEGGSFTSVTRSLGNKTGAYANATGGTATAGTGNLAGISLQTGVAKTSGIKSEGGFSDFEPLGFPSVQLDDAGVTPAALPAKTSGASFSQAFGVAVSDDLYKALQVKQSITVPVGADARLPQYQPTISRAQYVAIASDAFNEAKGSGDALLGTPTGIDTVLGVGNSGDKLILCRRAPTSGTQASSNQFFLSTFTGGDGPVAGAYVPADNATFGPSAGLPTFEVYEGEGTGNTRNCLNNVADTLSGFVPTPAGTKHYALGVLSLENSPATTAGTYRFVKINGVAGFDNVNNTASSIDGSYEFWYQSQKFANTPAAKTVLDAIDATLATGLTGVKGLFPNSASKFTRNDSNANPVTRK